MKKQIFSIALTILLFCMISVPVFASERVWTIRFLADGTMDSGNIQNGAIDESIGNMEPGDTETFHIKLRNEHKRPTRWYMKNDVIEHNRFLTDRRFDDV